MLANIFVYSFGTLSALIFGAGMRLSMGVIGSAGSFTFITVKEICARAGVNRSTFYLHYETIGDLLLEAIEKVNRVCTLNYR